MAMKEEKTINPFELDESSKDSAINPFEVQSSISSTSIDSGPINPFELTSSEIPPKEYGSVPGLIEDVFKFTGAIKEKEQKFFKGAEEYWEDDTPLEYKYPIGHEERVRISKQMAKGTAKLGVQAAEAMVSGLLPSSYSDLALSIASIPIGYVVGKGIGVAGKSFAHLIDESIVNSEAAAIASSPVTAQVIKSIMEMSPGVERDSAIKTLVPMLIGKKGAEQKISSFAIDESIQKLIKVDKPISETIAEESTRKLAEEKKLTDVATIFYEGLIRHPATTPSFIRGKNFINKIVEEMGGIPELGSLALKGVDISKEIINKIGSLKKFIDMFSPAEQRAILVHGLKGTQAKGAEDIAIAFAKDDSIQKLIKVDKPISEVIAEEYTRKLTEGIKLMDVATIFYEGLTKLPATTVNLIGGKDFIAQVVDEMGGTVGLGSMALKGVDVTKEVVKKISNLKKFITIFSPAEQRIIMRHGLKNTQVEGAEDIAVIFNEFEIPKEAPKYLPIMTSLSAEESNRLVPPDIMTWFNKINRELPLDVKQYVLKTVSAKEREALNLKSVTSSSIKNEKVKDSDIEMLKEFFSNTGEKQVVTEYIKGYSKKLWRDIKDVTEFGWRIAEFPRTRYLLEQAMGKPAEFYRNNIKYYKELLLNSGLENNEQLKIFKKLLVLFDMEESASLGDPTPLSRSTINKGIVILQNRAAKLNKSAEINKLIQDYWTDIRNLGEQLVAEGRIPKGRLRDKYYRHDVYSTFEDLFRDDLQLDPYVKTNDIIFGPKSYEKERVGIKRLYNTDVLEVLPKIRARLQFDMWKRQFITELADEHNILPKLTDAESTLLFGKEGVELGKNYLYKGRVYRPFSIKSDLETSEQKLVDSIFEKVETKSPTPVNPNEVKLVPVAIHNELSKFMHPKKFSALLDPMINITRIWKHAIIMYAGTTQFWKEYVSGLEGLYREQDWMALGKAMPFGEAMGRMYANKATDKELVSAVNAGLFRSGNPEKLAHDLDLIHLFSPKEAAKAIAVSPFRWMDNVYNIAQNSAKFAKYLADTTRYKKYLEDCAAVQSGKVVNNKAYYPQTVTYVYRKGVKGLFGAGEIAGVRDELKGLTPEEMNVRVAKLTVTDLATMPPEFRIYASSLLFPFFNWYYNNTKQWAKYSYRNPGALASQFLSLQVASQIWNYRVNPELEESLTGRRKYAPHIITNFKDEKGKVQIFPFMHSYQAAGSLLAFDAFVNRIHRVMFEGLDIKEAAKAQAQDIIGIEPAQGLINPVLKWMINSIRNRKSLMETGGMKGIKVRPEDASWKELIEEEAGYGLDLLGGPLAMYHRILNDADENTTHPILRSLTLRGPFRLKSTFTYGVNVEESKAKLRSLKGQEALEKRNQAKREFISKLVESAATGDSSVRIKAERNLRDSEFTGSIKKAFDSDLGKLIFQLKVVKRKKELAGTSEEKDKLNEIIKRLNKAIQFKKIKQSPKDVAAFMLDEEAELP